MTTTASEVIEPETLGTERQVLALIDLEPVPQPAGIWERIGPTSLDLHVGLRFARRLSLESFGLLGRIMRSAATVEQAAQVLERYSALACENIRLTVHSDDSFLRVRVSGPCNALLLPPHAEFLVTVWKKVLLELGPDLNLREVSVPFAPPQSSRILDDYLACPVTYRAQYTEVVMERSIANQPLPQANAPLCALLFREADHDLANVWPSRDFLLNAEAVYEAAFVRGDIQLSSLAREMRMSSRTLQRRLQNHNTSHRDMLDRVRRQRALYLLATTRSPLRVVALETGFAEPGAFCRAFRRWTAMSPGSYRSVYCGRSRWQTSFRR